MPPKLTPEQKAIREVEKQQYRQQYYLANREKQLEYARQWRANNPERCKEQDAEKRAAIGPYSTWTEAQKEAARRATRRYRATHPERVETYNATARIRRRERYRTDEEYRETAKRRSRQVMPEAQRLRRARLKDQVFSHYGAVCACCGETEKIFLTLDHVNDDGAEHRRKMTGKSGRESGGTVRVYLDVIRRGFPDDFQILCYNCNCGRFRNGGTCPHKRFAGDKLMKETPNTDAYKTGLLSDASSEVPIAASGLVLTPETVVN